MGTVDNDLSEYQKEWRAIVLDKLTSLELGQKELRSEMVDMKTTYARQQELEKLKEASRAEVAMLAIKVENLVSFKNKLIGITIGLNGLMLVGHFVLAFIKPA